jgi:methylmalonyl-CoA mutase
VRAKIEKLLNFDIPLRFSFRQNKTETMQNAEWKRLLLQSLKTGSETEKTAFYEQKLIQHPEPGIDIQPFYTDEDMAGLEYLQYFHEHWTKTRTTTGWMNTAWIFAADAKEANQKAKTALEQGVDAVCFNPAAPEVDFPTLLQDLSPAQFPVFFDMPVPVTEGLLHYLKKSKIHLPHLMGGIVTHGGVKNFFFDTQQQAEVCRFFKYSPFFKPMLVSEFEETHTKSLAASLQTAIRLIEVLENEGLAPTQTLPQIGFEVPVGKSFFLEIAKLRALRLLWWEIGKHFDKKLNLADVLIYAFTIAEKAPTEEPFENLIANTTQAMAALIGGCDTLIVLPHDQYTGKPDAFSERIARNISLILKEESYFDKTPDPAAGSYLIENLTHQLARNAWEKLRVMSYEL